MTCTGASSQARAWECGTGSSCFQYREARASLAGSQARAWEPVNLSLHRSQTPCATYTP